MIFDKRCMKRRHVNCCGECVRFQNCRDDTNPEFPYKTPNLRLGLAIICGVVEDYKKAYSQGKRKICQRLKKWFLSERVDVLSAETYDGKAIIEALERRCYKKYGDIEVIYKNKCNNSNQKIKELKAKANAITDPKKRGRILSKVSALRGELNE